MWLTIILIVIFMACLGLLYTEGMWTNALRLINVVTAALLATSFYEPLATWLDGKEGRLTYTWDFVALWVLFIVLSLAFRAVTDRVSRVKLKFLGLADRIGSVAFAAFIGWVLLCFTSMTLHTAPLGREFLAGSFKPEQRIFLGLAPDRQWLAFVQRVSAGQFSRKPVTEFDAQGEFLLKYAARRKKLEEQIKAAGGSLMTK